MIFPPVVVAGGRAEATFRAQMVDATSHAPSVPYTFSGVPFGPANAHRSIVVAAGIIGNGGLYAPASVTIGGVAATLLGNIFWVASVPAVSSGDVVVTGASAFGCYLAAWSVLRLRTTVAIDAKRYPANALPVSVATKAGGVVLAVSSGIFGTTDIVWSGMTENAQNPFGSSMNSCASLHTSSTGSASVNITLSGSGGNALYNLISIR